MGNRHYHGGGRGAGTLPSLGASWLRCGLSWLVTIAFVCVIAPGSGSAAGALIVFILLYPLIVVLMAGVVVSGIVTLVRALRGTGPRPGNLMFWLECLPAVIGVLAALHFWGLLSAKI